MWKWKVTGLNPLHTVMWSKTFDTEREAISYGEDHQYDHFADRYVVEKVYIDTPYHFKRK